jgi:uncharacterized protein (DUF2236 family)
VTNNERHKAYAELVLVYKALQGASDKYPRDFGENQCVVNEVAKRAAREDQERRQLALKN